METNAITVNDKAEAFDRIAAAYLEIPAGNPTIQQLADARRKLFDVVGAEVQALHPSYRNG